MADETPRINSLDLVRGAVMVLMAIDHVRVYSGLPAGGPTAGIFFTRWVTHFSAPAFAFLAGTAAFLHARKLADVAAMSRFLVTRGLFLVVLELTLLRFLWTFNFDYAHYILAGVIWMLGWCMVLLAGLIRFQPRTIAVVGLILIFLQPLVGLAGSAVPESATAARGLFQFLYFGGPVALGSGGASIAVLYSIVPWVGVMAAGYGFGTVMVRSPEDRRRLCLRIGLGATALFLAAAGLAVALQPAGENAPPVLFRLLGQRKYPASALFLLMTLGPTIALLPVAERARGWLADGLATFGRVPMFYYLLHIPLIHLAAMVVSVVRTGAVSPWLFGNHPMAPPELPAGYQWSLPLLYLVFGAVIAILYLPCRWFAALKARRKGGWLTYV